MPQSFSRSLRRFVPSGANPCSQRMLQSIAAVPWPSRARVSQTRMGTQTAGPGVGCSVRVGSGLGTCVGVALGSGVGA